jgi:hypothetical protein
MPRVLGGGERSSPVPARWARRAMARGAARSMSVVARAGLGAVNGGVKLALVSDPGRLCASSGHRQLSETYWIT